jgi:hypothetical protein
MSDAQYGGCDPPNKALRPPQSGGEPLVRPARGPVSVLLGVRVVWKERDSRVASLPRHRACRTRSRGGRGLPAAATPARAAEPVSFAGYQVTPAGTDAVAVAVGELNGDGKVDLVTADERTAAGRRLPDHRSANTSPAIRFPVSTCSAGMACEQVSRVIETAAWPRRSETTLGWNAWSSRRGSPGCTTGQRSGRRVRRPDPPRTAGAGR